MPISPEFLRWLRKRAGLTLEESHARSGLDSAQVSRFEHGLLHPNPDQLARLADAYGVTRYFVLLKDGFLQLPGFDALLDEAHEAEALDRLLQGASLEEKLELAKNLASLRMTSPLVEELITRRPG